MGVYLFRIFGSTCIGIYALATDKVLVLPRQVPEHRASILSEWLGVPVIRSSVSGSVLIGPLLCANSKGMLVPHTVTDEELRALGAVEEEGVRVEVMDITKITAFGNLVLANDKGAIVHPRFGNRTLKAIEDALDVEAVRGTVAGLPYVGSLAIATNKGVLAHPDIRDDEKALISEVLKVPVEVGTVNSGVRMVAIGLIANSRAAVAGFATTGREMAIIGRGLGVA